MCNLLSGKKIVQNVNFNVTLTQPKIIQIGKKKIKTKQNKTDDAGNKGSQLKKRRICGEQRELNGF